MFKWLHFLLTDENNQWDIGILIWTAGCALFLYKGFLTTPFDFTSFGVGFAAMLAGGAGLQWIRTSPPTVEKVEEKKDAAPIS